MSLTNEQLILLDNLIYLDDTVEITKTGLKTIYVRDVVNLLLEKSGEEFESAVTDSQFYYCQDMVNGMNPEQWRSILEAIK